MGKLFAFSLDIKAIPRDIPSQRSINGFFNYRSLQKQKLIWASSTLSAKAMELKQRQQTSFDQVLSYLENDF